ncbi:MAG TPA: BlaI/MecI/CopY family transcriptional regulator [Chloroflexia bacterium]|nr:BlaI/MecI/CopY family transcriptional regulator [Chloroflexia bacterium]
MDTLNEIKFRFNPSSSKSKKVLGPLEGEIMEVVWEQGRTTVSAVHKALREKKDVAYTTVMTTMGRLAKKNLLEQDTSSSTYFYTPVLSHSDFGRYVVNGVLKALVDDYGDLVVECVAEYVKDSPEAKQRLQEALQD